MKIQSFKRLYKTDFPEDFQALIDQLSFFFNNDIEPLYNVFNNNVSLKDNILCNVKDLSVTVDENGNPTSQLIIPLTNNLKAIGTMVINATNQTNTSVYPTSGVFVSFSQVQTGLQINNITGLQANNQYSLTLVVFG